MKTDTEPEYFPIRLLAERTGVGTSTLRAWERRYGLLKPRRTPKGHRLYTDSDVSLVQHVVDLLQDGHAISEVAKRILSNQEAIKNGSPESPGIGEDRLADNTSNLSGEQWDKYLERILTAIEEFSPQRLDAVYNEASSLYPLDLVSANLILPTLKVMGKRWSKRSTGIAEEHFFSAWLRNKLGARLHHVSSLTDGNTLLLACVPGHRHELGVLMFSLAALSRGYRVVYLGTDMPLEPLPEVVERCKARGVVLAAGRELDPETTIASMGILSPRLTCPLFVGGPLADRYKDALNDMGVIPIGEQFSLAMHLVTKVIPVHGSALTATKS